MACCQPNNKPLSESIMVCLLTHICATWPKWVEPFFDPFSSRLLRWEIRRSPRQPFLFKWLSIQEFPIHVFWMLLFSLSGAFFPDISLWDSNKGGHLTNILWAPDPNLNIACCSYTKNNVSIRSQLCTCHDSWAVMTCANLWPDLINKILTNTKKFQKISIMGSWIVYVLVPEQFKSTLDHLHVSLGCVEFQPLPVDHYLHDLTWPQSHQATTHGDT